MPRFRAQPFRRGFLAAALLWGLALGGPARALPVDVFFDGNGTPSDPDTNFGLSQTQALQVSADFDIEIRSSFSFVGSATGVLEETKNLMGFTPSPPTSSENRATSSWTVENVFGEDLLGATYFMFTHSDPFTVGGTTIDYLDENIGLRIDKDLGWIIVKAHDDMLDEDFYYPAILLDRTVMDPLDGELLSMTSSLPFDVNYVVKQALIAPAGSDYQLPEFEVGMAFAIVPEPGTAALFMIGLLGMAVRRRRG